MRWNRPFGALIAGTMALTAAGCGGVLPRSFESTESPWKTFDAAKAAFDQIEPGRSTMADLKDLGFDPETAPNARTLSYLEVQTRFMPTPAITFTDLDPDVRRCLNGYNACQGIQVEPAEVSHKRVGNAFLDIFDFRRETLETGWSFSSLILLRDGVVLYKTWNGSANIRTTERKENPLGPLQDLGGFAADRTQKAL